MNKGHSLQDPFLNTLRKERVPVSIFLVNGIKLQGQIESFDQFVVLLRNSVSQMVYKHAISTVVPSSNVKLPTSRPRRRGGFHRRLSNAALSGVHHKWPGINLAVTAGIPGTIAAGNKGRRIWTRSSGKCRRVSDSSSEDVPVAGPAPEVAAMAAAEAAEAVDAAEAGLAVSE